ncbi:MAG TPA: right-handed parallel beta-helix repeat-containing protein [Aeromicrobium sp.]|nr:right-handed parallel beta-helix repeat-containing protein [Aeromicrobium sp.]
MVRQKYRRRRHFWSNLRPATLLLLIPVLISFVTFAVVGSGLYDYHLARQAAKRLETHDWQAADQMMKSAEPNYRRKWGYYQIKQGQTVAEVAEFLGITVSDIEKDNKGALIPGATIRVRPIERPLTPFKQSRGLGLATVVVDGDTLFVKQSYGQNSPIRVTIPDLARRLQAYDAFDEQGNGTWRLNRTISIEGDIRLDVTSNDVKRLELRSDPNDIAALTFDGGSVLFKDVTVTSVNSKTGRPDGDWKDGRAFVRMKNGRMDSIGSTFTWLGNGLPQTQTKKALSNNSVLLEGATYGFSYRVSPRNLGQEYATGWVEDSTFENNHFGGYTFGTNGMLWKDNLFTHNDVYGLDPHDDSNNALVVGNRFLYNHKHGFIVSKRCNFNIIRNNTSVGNDLHGFMLHQDSAYNVIEDNVAYGNYDNYAIFHSNWNIIRNNRSYVPKSSHIRINDFAFSNYVRDNDMYGGRRGIYLYGNTGSTYIAGNHFSDVRLPIQTKGATYTFFGDNTAPSFNYDIAPGDKFIFGENDIDRGVDDIPTAAEVESGDYASGG